MFRIGFRSLLFVGIFSALVSVGARTNAAAISALTVQPGSSLEIVIGIPDLGASETMLTDVTGTIGPVELGWVDTPGGPLPDPLQIFGAALELSDATSVPGVPFLFELIGVGADLSGPEVSGFLPDGNMNSFDLQGYTLNLNQGEMKITGLTSASIDLSVTPFPLVITDPATVIAKVTETPTIDPLVYDVTMELSFDFMATIPPSAELPVQIDVFVVGTIVATGVKTVPEPSSAVLLIVALVSLATTRRR